MPALFARDVAGWEKRQTQRRLSNAGRPENKYQRIRLRVLNGHNQSLFGLKQLRVRHRITLEISQPRTPRLAQQAARKSRRRRCHSEFSVDLVDLGAVRVADHVVILRGIDSEFV